ncbi:hypothetical protein LEN26_014813 [Aphanomyces euteiches]|nr:hypothetical protein AeMF1_021311 [Aphanomyces euteiches]KAH9105295.1 hypothetical protein LEN26_014813 [Aphanomyces euteiches]KAH9194305.1 hypothetical protein AeNC1_003723 [Aphanomyces euteiches]
MGNNTSSKEQEALGGSSNAVTQDSPLGGAIHTRQEEHRQDRGSMRRSRSRSKATMRSASPEKYIRQSQQTRDQCLASPASPSPERNRRRNSLSTQSSLTSEDDGDTTTRTLRSKRRRNAPTTSPKSEPPVKRPVVIDLADSDSYEDCDTEEEEVEQKPATTIKDENGEDPNDITFLPVDHPEELVAPQAPLSPSRLNQGEASVEDWESWLPPPLENALDTQRSLDSELAHDATTALDEAREPASPDRVGSPFVLRSPQPAVICPSPSKKQSVRAFEWSDKSVHLAPENYTFPAGTCKEMWPLWIHGDISTGVCAFRSLNATDLTTNESKKRREATEAIMSSLVESAIAQALISSVAQLANLSLSELMTVFDIAMDRFLDAEYPGGPPRRRGLEGLSRQAVESEDVAIVHDLLTFAKRRHSQSKTTSKRKASTKKRESKSHQPTPEADSDEIKSPQAEPRSGAEGRASAREFDHVLLDSPDAKPRRVEPPRAQPTAKFAREAKPSTATGHLTTPREVIPNEAKCLSLRRMRMYTWSDGSQRLAPEGWDFPSLSCHDMWMAWFHGDPEAGVGPFQHLDAADVEIYPGEAHSSKGARGRLSEARLVMTKLVDIAQNDLYGGPLDQSIDEMVPSVALEVGHLAFDYLMHSNPEGSLASGRDHQLPSSTNFNAKVSTVCKAMRKSRRGRRMFGDDD